MRVVQLKRGRIVKFASIGLCIVGLLILVAHKSGYKLRSESVSLADTLKSLNLAGNEVLQKGQSYPEDLPSFLGNKKAGNYEPAADIKVTKSTAPGENGKAIHVRV